MSANQANSIAESLIRVCRLYQDIIKDSDAVLLLTNMVIDDKKPDTPGLVKQAIANAKNFQKAKLQQISDIFAKLKEQEAINKIMDEAGIDKPTLH